MINKSHTLPMVYTMLVKILSVSIITVLLKELNDVCVNYD